MQIAKIFQNGRSQAVRLPKEYRLEGKEVAVLRLGEAIVLQPLKKSWLDVHQYLEAIDTEFPAREDLPQQDRESLL